MGDIGRSIAVSASYDQSIRIWDMGMGTQLASLPHTEAQVNSVALTPDGYQLGVASWQKVRMYDMQTFATTPVVSFETVQKNVTVIGFQGEGRWMFTGGEDNSCRVYDMRGTQLQCQRIFEVRSSVNSVVIHPRNQVQLLISDSGGSVFVWDLRSDSHEILPQLCVPGEHVTHLSINPTATVLSGITNKGTVVQWALPSGDLVEWGQSPGVEDKFVGEIASYMNKKNVHSSHGLSCKYSPDGLSLVTTSSESKINVLDPNTLENQLEMDDNSQWNWDCTFTNDSKYMLTGGSDCCLKLYDMGNGQIVKKYEGHNKPITALCARDAK